MTIRFTRAEIMRQKIGKVKDKNNNRKKIIAPQKNKS